MNTEGWAIGFATVAGGPNGPEPATQSQPKALIDYRKGENNVD